MNQIPITGGRVSMLCQQCQQRPATVHLTQVINNEKREIHLCDQCANQQQMMSLISPFSINDFLTAFLGNNFMYPVNQQGTAHIQEMPACKQCGMTYEQFAKSGKLGCNNCYTVFGEMLNPVFRKIHGNVSHNGKVPNRAGGEFKVRRELEQLKSSLARAIQSEEYEKAAEIRDRIREIERNMKGEG